MCCYSRRMNHMCNNKAPIYTTNNSPVICTPPTSSCSRFHVQRRNYEDQFLLSDHSLRPLVPQPHCESQRQCTPWTKCLLCVLTYSTSTVWIWKEKAFHDFRREMLVARLLPENVKGSESNANRRRHKIWSHKWIGMLGLPSAYQLCDSEWAGCWEHGGSKSSYHVF